ncbi:uncharacterized membrane protein YheB (UPF0754 family) [Bacillus thermophilus]|uniref:Uncharacterized membrane protein YheB (UPF0754 family) n=1 Tax=Siminovitchia thermophila TaxID=1245522 RepID=A0ABS2R1G8_9BACI|nr:hypothetical protein [Siminovitchia thermophila]MBM7713496.1 uncharacterized membrane protein YheB (UPF0754 family) [Siminovitchia thermophila]
MKFHFIIKYTINDTIVQILKQMSGTFLNRETLSSKLCSMLTIWHVNCIIYLQLAHSQQHFMQSEGRRGWHMKPFYMNKVIML